MDDRSNAFVPESAVRCVHCGDAHPAAFTHCPRTGKPLSTGRALIGRIVADRYKVTGLLGEGGMGAVYVAEHLLIGRTVAIKRLHPELAADAKSVARFQREARAAASTGHENIVDILDMGFGEDGAPFLVMEFLKGHSLAETLRRDGNLPPARACFIVGQVLAGLSAVHAREIVHRDLKPDNVFLVKRAGRVDHVKVLDFGISKMLRETEALALTRTGVTLGTPFYMSPEHARGVKGLDHRVDLYATGVMLYECLSGRVPYLDANYHALLQAILRSEPPQIATLVPALDPVLSAIVHRAIARDPRDRFATAREMLLALVPFGAVDPGQDDDEPNVFTPRSDIGSLDTEAHRATTPIETRGLRSGPTPAGASVNLRKVTSSPADRSAISGTRPASSPPPPPPPPPIILQNTSSAGLRESRVPYAASPPAARAQRGDPSGPVRLAKPTPTSSTRPRPAGLDARASTLPEMRGSTLPDMRGSTLPDVRGSTLPETRVKGSLIVAALEHLERQHGRETLARITEDLEPGMRSTTRGMILPVAWLPLTLYEALLVAAERALGSGSGMVASELGAATASRDMPTAHRSFMQSATPTMAVDRIPQIWKLYHSTGEVKIEEGGTGMWRVEVLGVSPDSYLHTMAMAGFYQRLLELTGAREPRASVVQSRSRGDDRTITALRWR